MMISSRLATAAFGLSVALMASPVAMAASNGTGCATTAQKTDQEQLGQNTGRAQQADQEQLGQTTGRAQQADQEQLGQTTGRAQQADQEQLGMASPGAKC